MEFNGVDLSHLIITRKIRRSIAPPVSVSRLVLPYRNGSEDVRSNYTDRVINVDYTVMGTSREDMLEMYRCLAKLLDVSERVPIKFDDEDVFYLGRLDGATTTDEQHMIADGTLTFVCDPYKYGDEIINTTGALTNQGYTNHDWTLQLTLTGAGSGLVISNGTDSLEIVKALVATNVVLIDFKKRLITLNGLSVMDSLTFDSLFFPLYNGSNIITVTGATHTKLITYREIYL